MTIFTTMGLLFWLITVLQIGGVATNAPILVVIWSRNLLRTPSTRLVFSLCLSHLILSLILLLGSSCWIPSICITLLSLIVQLATLGTLTLISLDRYVSIARPMQRRNILTPAIVLWAIGLLWTVSTCLILPPGLLLLSAGLLWHIYFGLLLATSTFGSLTLMTLAYSHIFKIAREKCRKVRLGEFRRGTESFISSEWATSIGTVGSPLPLTQSSHSLNLKFLTQQLPSTNTSPPPNSVRSTPSLSSSSSSKNASEIGAARTKRRWRAYLRHNYNSPRKTVATILILIGSVVICFLPPALSLLCLPSLFTPLQSILLPLSSNLHPILYGILNRTIRNALFHGKRHALPKSLRFKKGQKRKVSTLGELRTIFIRPSKNYPTRRRPHPHALRSNKHSTLEDNSRRGLATSQEEGPQVEAMRPRLDTGHVGTSNMSKWRTRNPGGTCRSVVVVVEDENAEDNASEDEDEDVEIPPEAQVTRRKSSQDSGADMDFSDDDNNLNGCDEGGRLLLPPSLLLNTSQSESNLTFIKAPPPSLYTPLSLSAHANLNTSTVKHHDDFW